MGSGLSSAASRALPSPTGPAAPSSEEVAALQSQLAATKAESSKLAQQVARLEQEFAASSASTPHRTDSEAKLVQMENDVFSKTLDTLSAEVARLKADNDKLRDSVKEKQTDLSRSLAEANSLAAQLRLVQQQRGGAADVGVENRRASAALLDGQLFSFKLGERDVAKLRQIQRRTNFHEVSIDRIFDVFRQHAEGGCPTASASTPPSPRSPRCRPRTASSSTASTRSSIATATRRSTSASLRAGSRCCARLARGEAQARLRVRRRRRQRLAVEGGAHGVLHDAARRDAQEDHDAEDQVGNEPERRHVYCTRTRHRRAAAGGRAAALLTRGR